MEESASYGNDPICSVNIKVDLEKGQSIEFIAKIKESEKNKVKKLINNFSQQLKYELAVKDI